MPPHLPLASADPARVLLVGGSLDERRALELLLVGAGHQVASAATPAQAATAIAEVRAELVIVHDDPPAIDGLGACRLLAAQPGDNLRHLMVLSSRRDSQRLTDALRAGADEFIARPVPDGDMLARVAAAIRQQRRWDAERATRIPPGVLEDERRAESLARKHAASTAASEARQRAMVESALDCVISIEADGRIVAFNPAAENTFGFRAADVIGKRLSDTIVPHALRADHEAGLKRYLAGGTAKIIGRRVEVPALRADGSAILVELTITPVSTTTPPLFTAFLRDITERRHLDNQLRESESRFRELAETIQDVFYVLESGVVTYVSPAVEAVLGRSAESVYADAHPHVQGIHPDDRPGREAAHQRKLAGRTTDVEFRVVKPDGDVRWIRDRSYPVGDGPPGRKTVGVLRDITERKQTLERVREQAALLDMARDAIVVRDLNHRVTYWNASAERLYGWAAQDIVGQSILNLYAPGDAEFKAASDHVLRTGEWVGEVHPVTKSGVRLTVDSHWTLVRDAAGQPASVMTITTDVTEQKGMEQQLLRAQRLESIGVLAGGIAHDLNNVLVPVILAAEMLGDGAVNDDQQELASTILTSAQRARDMVSQVLTFARGQDGRRTEVKGEDLLQGVERIVKDTFPKLVQIHTSGQNLQAIVGDETQLHQVLLNLCVNARDAMPFGGRLTLDAENVVLSTHDAARYLGATPGPYVSIAVTDTGTGMSAAVVDRIFDPFFTTKAVGQGTGLGLSTSLAIVKNHGGFLTVESEPGVGTTFRLFLPAQRGAPARRVESGDRPRGNGEVVLVVDDERALRELAKRMLERHGYTVLVAADGAEALTLYRQRRGDVAAVIVDMMMPVMDGAATIAALRALHTAVPIVAVSGFTADAVVAGAGGPTTFVAKPYRAAELLDALRRVLEGSAGL